MITHPTFFDLSCGATVFYVRVNIFVECVCVCVCVVELGIVGPFCLLKTLMFLLRQKSKTNFLFCRSMTSL